jgi:subtilisin-like proprotein convertase family protein
MAKGDGTWRLLISDSAAGDEGFVYNWSVHLLCETPISVEDQSWGEVKALYQD